MKIRLVLTPAANKVDSLLQYPLWVNVGSVCVTMLLAASLLTAFFDGHIAVGLAAIAFCGVWLFGNAAERFDLQ